MSWTPVAPVAEVGPGCARAFEVGDQRIALCHAADAFYAIDDECTHDGAPLDQGLLDGHQIECPRHGARFDITTGKVVRLPAVRPVRTYPARVVDGLVEVDLS